MCLSQRTNLEKVLCILRSNSWVENKIKHWKLRREQSLEHLLLILLHKLLLPWLSKFYRNHIWISYVGCELSWPHLKIYLVDALFVRAKVGIVGTLHSSTKVLVPRRKWMEMLFRRRILSNKRTIMKLMNGHTLRVGSPKFSCPWSHEWT